MALKKGIPIKLALHPSRKMRKFKYHKTREQSYKPKVG